MNKELVRVPELFDWPIGKPFEGERPMGTGYQIWNPDKNAPVSPVFKTEHGAVLWLREQGYSWKKAAQIVHEGQKVQEN